MQFYIAIVLFCGWTCFTTGAADIEDLTSCPTLYSSCNEAYERIKCSGKTPKSGYYMLRYKADDVMYTKRVYCDMQGAQCDGKGGWMRVSQLDMTVHAQCPSGLDQGTYGSKKLCGNRGSGCKSTYIPNYGIPYTEVCGFVVGYQHKTPDAFYSRTARIDHTYVDGISITYGEKPRKHIWTYAAGYSASGTAHRASLCPCNTNGLNNVPAFVGKNWYCESGNPTNKVLFQFFGNDVLWDGKKCTGNEGNCCKNPSLPYFYTELQDLTTSKIELRVCHNQAFADEDVPIESYEFFIR